MTPEGNSPKEKKIRKPYPGKMNFACGRDRHYCRYDILKTCHFFRGLIPVSNVDCYSAMAQRWLICPHYSLFMPWSCSQRGLGKWGSRNSIVNADCE